MADSQATGNDTQTDPIIVSSMFDYVVEGFDAPASVADAAAEAAREALGPASDREKGEEVGTVSYRGDEVVDVDVGGGSGTTDDDNGDSVEQRDTPRFVAREWARTGHGPLTYAWREGDGTGDRTVRVEYDQLDDGWHADVVSRRWDTATWLTDSDAADEDRRRRAVAFETALDAALTAMRESPSAVSGVGPDAGGNPNGNPNDDGGREVQAGLGTQPGTIEFSTSEAADFVRDLVDDAGSHAIATAIEGGDADLLPEQQVKLREAIDVLGGQRVADLADASIDRDDDADEGAFAGQQTLGQAATRSLSEFEGEEPPNPTERLVSATPGGTTEFFPAFEKSSARYTTTPDAADAPPDARCRNCAHYIPGGGCHAVRGPIDPEAVCQRFFADAGAFWDNDFADADEQTRLSLLLERGGLGGYTSGDINDLARELQHRVTGAAVEEGGGV